MHIYLSGIGGSGLAPLAQLAQDVGFEVAGSDLIKSPNLDLLHERGITVYTGQTGREIATEHRRQPLDWVVVSSAITDNHPEVAFAKEHGIKISKRDELLNHILKTNNLKLIATSGTHGKTTLTALLVWTFKQLGEPVSYSVGTNVSFGASAAYEPGSKFFVYEADEFDRNFLSFKPYASLLGEVDYDHTSTYPAVDDYKAAFGDFIAHSGHTWLWQTTHDYLELADTTSELHVLDERRADTGQIKLAGEHNRRHGFIVTEIVKWLLPDRSEGDIIKAVNAYPGSQRRMEKLADYLYTDYAHHPAEIAATLQLASELSDAIVAVYQPHQNTRQHELAGDYQDCFVRAKHVYWLPTYLSREDPDLPVLEPAELIKRLDHPELAEPAEMNAKLATTIKRHREAGDLVVLMGAGSIDDWARANLSQML